MLVDRFPLGQESFAGKARQRWHRRSRTENERHIFHGLSAIHRFLSGLLGHTPSSCRVVIPSLSANRQNLRWVREEPRRRMGVMRESQASGTSKKQVSRCALKDKKILVSDESRHVGYAVVQFLARCDSMVAASRVLTIDS